MLKKKKILLVLIILLVSLSFTAVAEDFKRSPRLNFNGVTGDEFIGQAGVLYPFRNTEDSTWFTDFRYRMSEDDVDEWNLGLGYRRKIDTAENHIAGIYAYKDRREEYDHYWDMWTVGGEILTDQWDFRLNTYITDNDKVLAPGAVAGGSSLKVNSDQVLVYTSGSEIYYKSMNGLDIEIGKRFTETDTIFKNVGVYAKLFRFFESDTPTMTGRQIRINKQFGDRDKITWKIGAQWRYDNIRGSETEATFAVSIPFGEGKLAKIEEPTPEEIVEARMTEQPERDLDVVVGESVREERTSVEEILVKNPAKPSEYINVWYVSNNNNTGDGSEENPFNINEFINHQQNININDGDIIVLSGQDGVIELNSRIFLYPYQQIISSFRDGHALVDVEINGRLVKEKFIPEVESAKLQGSTSAGFFITLDAYTGHNTISGIKFENNSSSPRTINGKFEGFVRIDNNYIVNNPVLDAGNNEKSHGIYITQDAGFYDEDIFKLNIENNYIKNVTSSVNFNDAVGIYLRTYNRGQKVSILNNEVVGFKAVNEPDTSNDFDSGIFVNEYSNNPIISGNVISNSNYGITNSNSLVLYNNFEDINRYPELENKYSGKNIINISEDNKKVVIGEFSP